VTTLSKCNVTVQIRHINSGSTDDYHVLVADVASQLAWIVAAFKEPPEGAISFSTAKIEGVHDIESLRRDDRPSLNFRIEHANTEVHGGPGEGDGTCWHQLFTDLNVAVGFPIPPRPVEMHGVELPISLMTAFAGVGYPVGYKDGFVLKGQKNALFPVWVDPKPSIIGEASSIQWHHFASAKARLYMAEAEERNPELSPVKTARAPTEFLDVLKQPKRHFLGLYRDARICAGTADSQAELVATTVAYDCVQEKTKWPIEWSRAINFSVGGSVGGVSLGLSTGFRIRSHKERQLRFTYNPDLQQYLEDARTKLVILYNVQTKVAWLLPQIHVIMHLVQAWAKTRYPNTTIVYPDFNDMSQERVEVTFREFQNQALASELSIDFEHTFKEFSNLLEQLRDNEDLKPSRRLRPSQLAGVDFTELKRMPPTYSTLTTKINLESSGDWPQVLKSNWTAAPEPHRVITLFCSNLNPQPILPRGMACSTWYPPPQGQSYLTTTIFCLRLLAERYGQDPVMLSPEHVWERGTYGPHDICPGRCCDRLQKMKRLNKRRGKSMFPELSRGSDFAAVVFGGVFCMDNQNPCSQSHIVL
jgi:hypothetical protein